MDLTASEACLPPPTGLLDAAQLLTAMARKLAETISDPAKDLAPDAADALAIKIAAHSLTLLKDGGFPFETDPDEQKAKTGRRGAPPTDWLSETGKTVEELAYAAHQERLSHMPRLKWLAACANAIEKALLAYRPELSREALGRHSVALGEKLYDWERKRRARLRPRAASDA